MRAGSRTRAVVALVTILLALLSATPPAAAASAASAVVGVRAVPAVSAATGGCGDDMGTKQVVILVHGFNSDQSTWTKVKPNMEAAVHQASPDNVYVRFFDYSSRSTEWVTDAGIGPALATFARCLSKASTAAGGPGKVILVGHSMGGLAIRCALDAGCTPDPLESSRVGLVVTLGTPNSGSQIRPGPLADAGTQFLGKMLLSRCDVAQFLALQPLISLCDEVRAITVSPAGQAFTIGSRQLKVLGRYPPGIPVRAIAGSAGWWQMGIGRWVSPRKIPMGDFVVSVSSQLLLHTNDRLGGTRTVDCGLATLGAWANCWHSTETEYVAFETEVLKAVRDYLAVHPLPPRSALLPAFGQSAGNARELEAFLRAGVPGFEPVAGSPGVYDRCQSIRVFGADLAGGALDMHFTLTPGGVCDGDAAGTDYQVRGHKVTASSFGCGDCDWATPTGPALNAEYGTRRTSIFTIAATGDGTGWRLVSEPPRGG